MTNPARPLAPASKPSAPVAPAIVEAPVVIEAPANTAPAIVAPVVVAEKPAEDVSSIEVTTGIQIETNQAVGTAAPAKLESAVTVHPVGIQIETFLGLQPNVAWVDPNAVAQPVAADGDE